MTAAMYSFRAAHATSDPLFTSQPTDQTVTQGDDANFSTGLANSSTPLALQWQAREPNPNTNSTLTVNSNAGWVQLPNGNYAIAASDINVDDIMLFEPVTAKAGDTFTVNYDLSDFYGDDVFINLCINTEAHKYEYDVCDAGLNGTIQNPIMLKPGSSGSLTTTVKAGITSQPLYILVDPWRDDTSSGTMRVFTDYVWVNIPDAHGDELSVGPNSPYYVDGQQFRLRAQDTGDGEFHYSDTVSLHLADKPEPTPPIIMPPNTGHRI